AQHRGISQENLPEHRVSGYRDHLSAHPAIRYSAAPSIISKDTDACVHRLTVSRSVFHVHWTGTGNARASEWQKGGHLFPLHNHWKFPGCIQSFAGIHSYPADVG